MIPASAPVDPLDERSAIRVVELVLVQAADTEHPCPEDNLAGVRVAQLAAVVAELGHLEARDLNHGDRYDVLRVAGTRQAGGGWRASGAGAAPGSTTSVSFVGGALVTGLDVARYEYWMGLRFALAVAGPSAGGIGGAEAAVGNLVRDVLCAFSAAAGTASTPLREEIAAYREAKAR